MNVETVELVISHHIEEPLDRLLVEKMPHDVKMCTAIRETRSILDFNAREMKLLLGTAARLAELLQSLFGVKAAGGVRRCYAYSLRCNGKPVTLGGYGRILLESGSLGDLIVRTFSAFEESFFFDNFNRTRNHRNFSECRTRRQPRRQNNNHVFHFTFSPSFTLPRLFPCRGRNLQNRLRL